MWIFFFCAVLVIALFSVYYLTSRIRKTAPFQKLAEKHKKLSWAAAALPVIGIALGFCLINPFTMLVVLLYFMFIWLFCEVAMIRVCKTLIRIPHTFVGAAATLLTAVALGFGWHNAHHVEITEYQLQTDKNLGGSPLRVVMFADSHLGITLDGESFARQTKRIQEQKPDLVIIAGDFVDDDSTKKDMLEACAALGQLETTYGVFYTFGNHDNGYYQSRDFTGEELRDALTANHVVILEDEVICIDDRFYLAGRLDKYYSRKEAQELTAELDSDKYIIMADHQPNDYRNETEAGADLVLSGHTHGGHMFPAGQIGLLLRMNDALYGKERRGSTDFIVTSGISGWAIPFKIGCVSEFCVIDIAEG